MSEGKYGRLFTTRDVEAMLEAAHDHGWASADMECPEPPLTIEAAINGAEDRGRAMTFSSDEPLFLLRGQDVAAPGGVGAYSDECERVGAPAAHVHSVHAAGGRMLAWQLANQDRTKVPD